MKEYYKEVFVPCATLKPLKEYIGGSNHINFEEYSHTIMFSDGMICDFRVAIRPKNKRVDCFEMVWFNENEDNIAKTLSLKYDGYHALYCPNATYGFIIIPYDGNEIKDGEERVS